ncbi:hypothetical protein Q7C36_010907 [Tachysurus vachellii]|uniref:Uncharacterized protein n=1 Tax=Tachysurus vachellii TaxID=175792 RepID=A0AA88N1N8_TACVA|nr:hypothetical protein Q7C36_010907 [Tachysurus vachellii]
MADGKCITRKESLQAQEMTSEGTRGPTRRVCHRIKAFFRLHAVIRVLVKIPTGLGMLSAVEGTGVSYDCRKDKMNLSHHETNIRAEYLIWLVKHGGGGIAPPPYYEAVVLDHRSSQVQNLQDPFIRMQMKKNFNFHHRNNPKSRTLFDKGTSSECKKRVRSKILSDICGPTDLRVVFRRSTNNLISLE